MFLNPNHVLKQIRFRDNVSIADLGAGSGEFSIPLARQLLPYGEVVAVDVNPNILSFLAGRSREENLTNLHLLQGDLEIPQGTGIRDGVLDGALLTNTLFQLDNPAKGVNETKRVLKPEGTVLVVDWRGSFGGIGPKEDSVLTRGDVQKLFLDSGFTLYNEIDAGDYHYGFIFKKK